MKCSDYTKRFFMNPCVKGEFPGYNSCLTGSGVASALGISPWESRQELFQRLTREPVHEEMTWEMRRGVQYKEVVMRTFAQNSPSEVFRYNPFNKKKRFYVSNMNNTGVGGVVDAFLVNRKTGNVSAGLAVRTAGLSSLDYWADYPSMIHVAQGLFYSGLCGGLPWVISVMLFRPDTNHNNEERIPFEIRSFWMLFDKEVFEHIYGRVVNFWKNNFMKGVEPEVVDPTETKALLDNYIQRKTAILRITPPFARKK